MVVATGAGYTDRGRAELAVEGGWGVDKANEHGEWKVIVEGDEVEFVASHVQNKK